MATERDLSALLPPMPPPRPDAREAAIGEALRRFDGEAPHIPAKPAPPRRALGRPQIGALVAAALVATIGLPLWLSGDLSPSTHSESSPGPASIAPADTAAVDVPTDAASAGQAAGQSAAETTPALAPAPRAAAVPPRTEEAREAPAEMAPPPPPAPAPPPAIAAMPSVAAPAPPPAAAADAPNDEVVVTGSRVTARAQKAQARSEQRRERPIATLASQGSSRAAPAATDTASFAPDSATTWLERGLANARAGDDKRALADLDRAVKLAPGDAAIRYQRSLVLRRLGKVARADADAAKAAELDPRYKTGN